MKKISIAIIDHVGLKAGMECYDLGLFSALKEAGCSPVVYSNFAAKEEGILPVFHFRVHENIISLFRLTNIYSRIARDLKVNSVDCCILHCFKFGFWEWLFMRKIANASVKSFLIVHDPESLIRKRSFNKWRDRMFGLADAIVVHNKFCYEEILKQISRSAVGKVAIIPHGNFISEATRKGDIGKFKVENDFKAGRKYILFFGQIKETKGLDLLLKALAMTDNVVDLVIAGRMRRHSFNRYNQLIEENNLKGRVKLFIGYVTPETRDILFQLADAVVLPYRKVYQSGVMLMAMSYGKAVIASDLPPNREIIIDKQNGFLFRADDANDLKRVLMDVIMNDAKREATANAGFQFVKEKLDWNIIAGEWIKQLQS